MWRAFQCSQKHISKDEAEERERYVTDAGVSVGRSWWLRKVWKSKSSLGGLVSTLAHGGEFPSSGKSRRSSFILLSDT